MAATYTQVGATDSTGEPSKGMIARDCEAFKDIMCSGINVLLIFVPLGLVSKKMQWNSGVIFLTNFTGIMPLAGILGSATESLAEHTGQTIGGLVNASFGNAVEIIITIDAIERGLCDVVQAGLIGSVLSNLLLVLGMAMVASGFVRKEQAFNKDGAGASTSCLLVAATGVAIPTLFASEQGTSDVDRSLQLSRYCAIIMACVYGFFLIFQLGTHKHHFEDVGSDEKEDPAIRTSNGGNEIRTSNGGNEVGRLTRRSSIVGVMREEEEEEKVMSPITSTVVLLLATIVIAQLSELMVGSIEDVSEDYDIPKSFIGLILLPIVGNAAEHMTAVVAAFKGKMDLAIGVAVGSSTQIALLVVPFSIMIGWYFDEPMDLNFGTFFSGIFLLAVFLVTSVLNDGSSNWLEGLMLIATYVMVAVICWFVPNKQG